MRIVAREIRTFLVTQTTEDGTEISESAARDAVMNNILEGKWQIHVSDEVKIAPDLTLWEIKVEKRHILDI